MWKGGGSVHASKHGFHFRFNVYMQPQLEVSRVLRFWDPITGVGVDIDQPRGTDKAQVPNHRTETRPAPSTLWVCGRCCSGRGEAGIPSEIGPIVKGHCRLPWRVPASIITRVRPRTSSVGERGGRVECSRKTTPAWFNCHVVVRTPGHWIRLGISMERKHRD